MVSALDSGTGGPSSRPGLGHCVVLLGKTIFSRSTSIHRYPGLQMGTGELLEQPNKIAGE